MHAWLTSNIWSSLEVWFRRVQLWLSSRFFSSSVEGRSSPRLPTHPQKNGREKILNKKKSNFILPFMCKCAAICAFDSDRAPDFSLYGGASHRGFVLEWVGSPGGDEEAAQLLIDNYFPQIPSLPLQQGPLQHREPKVLNYVDLLRNRRFILMYC